MSKKEKKLGLYHFLNFRKKNVFSCPITFLSKNLVIEVIKIHCAIRFY